jgi:uncharacterized membrane protein YbjE (DUF340 family)
VIHKEGLCPSSRDVNRLLMMMMMLLLMMMMKKKKKTKKKKKKKKKMMMMIMMMMMIVNKINTVSLPCKDQPPDFLRSIRTTQEEETTINSCRLTIPS